MAIATENYNTQSDNEIRQINDRLMLTERIFLREIPSLGPSMYNHVIYRPDPHNKYGSEKFPSIYFNLYNGDWRGAQIQIETMTLLIQNAADYLSMTY